jgi:hypothetical protein
MPALAEQPSFDTATLTYSNIHVAAYCHRPQSGRSISFQNFYKNFANLLSLYPTPLLGKGHATSDLGFLYLASVIVLTQSQQSFLTRESRRLIRESCSSMPLAPHTLTTQS